MGSNAILVDRLGTTFREWWLVGILQALFLATALVGINAPIDSMHYVRQDQTYDVSRQVFHVGWPAAFTPRSSFSQLAAPDDTYAPVVMPTPRYTIIHLEVPFHGLFGWPAAMLFPNHELVIVRLVSVIFAMLSIQIVYLVLRHWLDPTPSLAGAALWATSPFVVYFGQVSMPDILATTGVAIAFLYALRGNIVGSSAAFLFAILAKLSVILYGLPILVALLEARACRSIPQFLALSVAWGLAPLVGIVGWISLSAHDPYGSWVVHGGYSPGNYGPLTRADLEPKLFLYPLSMSFWEGIFVGAIGWYFTLKSHEERMSCWLKLAILVSIVANYALESPAWHEPQYTLPVLFWLNLGASFGFPALLASLRLHKSWRTALVALVVIQLAVVCGAVAFMKASRVPNLPSIKEAGALVPPDGRVAVYSYTANACPSAWIDRNTLTLDPVPLDIDEPAAFNHLCQQLENIHKAGFDYLMVFDIQQARKKVGTMGSLGEAGYSADFTSPSTTARKLFDAKYPKLFEGNHVLLYSLVH